MFYEVHDVHVLRETLQQWVRRIQRAYNDRNPETIGEMRTLILSCISHSIKHTIHETVYVDNDDDAVGQDVSSSSGLPFGFIRTAYTLGITQGNTSVSVELQRVLSGSDYTLLCKDLTVKVHHEWNICE